MAEYLSSTAIRVFPTAYRGSEYQPSSWKLVEQDFTDLATLGREKNFVVGDWGNDLVVVLGGYIFKFSSAAVNTLMSNADSIFAFIEVGSQTLAEGDVTTVLKRAEGTGTTLDDGTKFKGIGFVSSEPASGTYIQIKETIEGTPRVPNGSKIVIGKEAIGNGNGKPISEELTVQTLNADEIIVDATGTESEVDIKGFAQKAKNDGSPVNSGLGNVIHETYGSELKNPTANVVELHRPDTGATGYETKISEVTVNNVEFASKVGSASSHPAIGADDKPVYVNSNGVVTASNASKGSNVKPIYMDGGQITESTANVGGVVESGIKPIYVNSGELTAFEGNLGNNSQPVYMESGTLKAGKTYAGGTKITLNGTDLGNQSASIYAPTGAGTAGQVLCSNGANQAPVWSTSLYNGKGWSGNLKNNAVYISWGGGTNKELDTFSNWTVSDMSLFSKGNSTKFSATLSLVEKSFTISVKIDSTASDDVWVRIPVETIIYQATGKTVNATIASVHTEGIYTHATDTYIYTTISTILGCDYEKEWVDNITGPENWNGHPSTIHFGCACFAIDNSRTKGVYITVTGFIE